MDPCLSSGAPSTHLYAPFLVPLPDPLGFDEPPPGAPVTEQK
jgi:hypothetical protein